MNENLEADKPEIPIGMQRWVAYIKDRIKRNKNFLGVFIGPTGSGKSYSALELADALMDYKLPKENVCFKASTFLARLDDGLRDGTLKRGDVILWEETGLGLNAKQWQSKANKIINSVMQVFRTENIIVLMTVPYLSFIDSDARKLIHAFFQTIKIDKKSKVVITKAFNIQVNQITGKPYTKYLIARLPNGAKLKTKRVAFPIPRRELVDFYEETAAKFKREVISNARIELEKVEAPKTDKRWRRGLTPRQLQVFTLMQDGLNQTQIAEKLALAQPTVHHIMRFIGEKLNFPIENASFQDQFAITQRNPLNLSNQGSLPAKTDNNAVQTTKNDNNK